MGLMEFFDKLAEPEDEKLMGVFKKLYGPFVQIALIYPSFRRENLPLTFFLFIFTFSVFLYHYYLLSMSIFKSLDNFELASLAFHYWMIFTFTLITLPLLIINRHKMGETHRYLQDNLGEYKSVKIYQEGKPTQYEKNKRLEFIRFLFLPGMVVCLASGLLLIPYIRRFTNPPHYSENGVNLNLPIAAWYPYSTHEGINHGLAVLGQLMTGGNLALTLGTLEVILFRVAQSIIFEYKVLQYGIETVFSRAKKLYWKRNASLAKAHIHFKDPEYQKCVTECFKECVRHHYKIRVVLAGFEYLIKWPGALAYGFGTGVIGLSLVNVLIAKESENYENVVLFLLLSVVESLNMFMLSVIGESITTETKVLRDELYFIEWYKLDITNRRMMLNFQMGVTNPVIVYAGGLVALCMDTFSSIMNTSYSFFNLVNADMGNKDEK
uniref:Odorant receptor n=1 Tax=Adelphocoris lineolatus TaxID=236346 RepID=A0A2I4PH28_ADELI|nr:olfactory receptor 39 [Adelphocoris lineolatus]